MSTMIYSFASNEKLENKIIEQPIVEQPIIVYKELTKEGLITKLNKNLKGELADKGELFANECLEKGVDPYLAVAIVLHETGCKWNCSKLVVNCNNVGGMKGKPGCNGGSYKKFDSLDEGIIAFINNLSNNYYAFGLNTPELMNPKYAEGKTWASKVNKYIEEISES